MGQNFYPSLLTSGSSSDNRHGPQCRPRAEVRGPCPEGLGRRPRLLGAGVTFFMGVRFASSTGHDRGRPARQRRAISDQSAPQQKRAYSITSSAVARRFCGIARPSALAVFKLKMVAYLVAACTGKSDAFSPLRMRST
jgi:hypothetical protein